MHQREERLKGHAEEAKRQGNEPDDGKENQREEREWPREREENAPGDKGNQRFHRIAFHSAVKRQPGPFRSRGESRRDQSLSVEANLA